MRDTEPRRRRHFFGIFLHLLYAASLIVIAYFLIRGASYYKTPYRERPRQEDYRTLRPAGTVGHGFGVVGSTMVVLMLGYSLRKRTRLFGRRGSLRHWLDIHIYFGVVGPLLIVLHTSFKVQGLVAVSFWSMVAVVLSGILGRYLYLKIPRNIQGDELGRSDVERLSDIMAEQLTTVSTGAREVFEKLEKTLAPNIREDAGPVASLAAVMRDDLSRPIRMRRARHLLTHELHLPPETQHRVLGLVAQKASMHRKVILMNRIQQLFHYWNVFHKPFAIVMYLIMAVHITIAVWLGYTWIF